MTMLLIYSDLQFSKKAALSQAIFEAFLKFMAFLIVRSRFLSGQHHLPIFMRNVDQEKQSLLVILLKQQGWTLIGPSRGNRLEAASRIMQSIIG
jgi:hypothetical protein